MPKLTEVENFTVEEVQQTLPETWVMEPKVEVLGSITELSAGKRRALEPRVFMMGG